MDQVIITIVVEPGDSAPPSSGFHATPNPVVIKQGGTTTITIVDSATGQRPAAGTRIIAPGNIGIGRLMNVDDDEFNPELTLQVYSFAEIGEYNPTVNVERAAA